MQKVKLEPGRKCIYRTHTTREGAERYCGFFMGEVKAKLPSFAEWLK